MPRKAAHLTFDTLGTECIHNWGNKIKFSCGVNQAGFAQTVTIIVITRDEILIFGLFE